jgi:hypothetical protein
MMDGIANEFHCFHHVCARVSHAVGTQGGGELEEQNDEMLSALCACVMNDMVVLSISYGFHLTQSYTHALAHLRANTHKQTCILL